MTDSASPEPAAASDDQVKQPGQCADMTDVRMGVDAVDAALMSLLAVRLGYMRAAARIPEEKGAVRDEARKAEVIDNALNMARGMGVPDALVAELWDRLIEGSIAYEMDEWERLRG